MDEAVALGACIYAGMKTETTNLNAAQKSAVDAVQLQEVASHNFGTIVQIYNESKNTMERAVAIIIPRNTTLPASHTETYETLNDGQTMVPCTITQDTFGSERVNMVKIIKETQLGPLPEGRPAGQPIEVTYSYDENAVMKCIFTDVNSKINQEVDISISSSAKKIDSSIEELEAFILE